jgi:Flp pilus assembly protein TadG
MQRRKRTSGGQALVLITLALFAMGGIMGLAVDLGWSFFVQKQAQAAADAAALGAVEEAVLRIRSGGGSVTGFTCASSGTGSTQVDCEASISCGAVTATSNLNNGCQYALKNGFNWTSASKQNVTLQSSDITTEAPPTAPGVTNISYWVTARTVQTVPQLFSALLGNRNGTVSAIATAAVAGSIAPGSLYGMNHKGDCVYPAGSPVHCGVDIYIDNHGGGKGSSTTCPDGSGAHGKVCAPAGIILASSCGSPLKGVCDDNGYAGVSVLPGVEASSAIVMTGGVLSPGNGLWHDAAGNDLTPSHSSNPKTFQDPTAPNPQPPLQASSPIPACGLPNGVLQGGSGNGGALTVKPYQFFAYSGFKNGIPIATGGPIQVSGNVTFDASTGVDCSSLGGGAYPINGTAQSTSFPTYIFYGGMQQSGTTHFGPGQYIFAGAGPGSSGNVFSSGGTVTGDTATGTMWVFTDANYPGLAAQQAILGPVNLPTGQMTQGSLGFKNPTITLSGIVDSHVSGSNLPPNMDVYSGIAWWQDRRNSTVGYSEASGQYGCADSTNCTGDNGSVVYCAQAGECADGGSQFSNALTAMQLANHATNTSPGVLLDPGNGSFTINGVYYQPRGAWVEFKHGTTGGSGRLQIITGAVIADSGDTTLLLNGPTNPIQQFKATLIQ